MNRRQISHRKRVAAHWLGYALGMSIVSIVAVAGSAPTKGNTGAQGHSQNSNADKPASPAPQLSFKLRKVRNSKGKVGCALFNNSSGFPMKPAKAYRRIWCPIVAHDATCTVPSLPPGTYAAVCIHDENGNGKLDTNWIGFPKEGVVASNHAKGRFGPPSFKDASFSVGRKPKTVHMRIGY